MKVNEIADSIRELKPQDDADLLLKAVLEVALQLAGIRNVLARMEESLDEI